MGRCLRTYPKEGPTKWEDALGFTRGGTHGKFGVARLEIMGYYV